MRSLSKWVVALLASLLIAAPTAHADAFEQDPFAGDALAAAADVPEEFVEETAFDNLLAPASIAFSPDGRVFVGQLDGVIKVYDGVQDTTPSVYADISENVAWHNDRGLMSITLDPGFASGRPFLYVSYTYDAAIGGTAPRWNDNCPDPPGAERDGCVVSGRVSKILPDGSEQPLIKDEWCQQYPSHSLGDLQFGVDGALYITAGDGASYTFADYGQDGSPTNPCGDPGAPVGGNMTSPTAEGGALRSQDARTSADPTGLAGAMLRVDPDTGEPLPDNPGTGDKNARRIIAYGFRNPFRFAFRPGTTDAYVGDVGWLQWEELDRVPDTTSQVRNYGWPCYEGTGRQSGYEAIGLNTCRDLYASGSALPPLYTYSHAGPVASDGCAVGTSSISGVTFYEGTTFPPAYRGALFFADYARNCIWVMFADANGIPNPATRQVFVEDARTPVDLEIGPGGDLYYADVGWGTIRRIRAINPNQEPSASIATDRTEGAAPLRVEFDATGSSDPNGDPLQYAWDLDGDGAYDDSTSPTPSRTYETEGMVTVRLRVTDPAGSSDTETVQLTVGIPPSVTISGPSGDGRYAVGDRVDFSGSARRADGTTVPDQQLLWSIELHHCSAIVTGNCHVHRMTDYVGVDAGWLAYPDHEYPSYLTLTLTATEASGLRGTASIRIDPKTVDLRFTSAPDGMNVGVGGEASRSPFTRTVAQGATVGVAAPPTQSKEGYSYDFDSWSDGGAAAHQITAPAAPASYHVTYSEAPCPVREGLVGSWGFDEPSGNLAYDTSGRGNSGTITGATRSSSGRFGGALSFDGLNDLVAVGDSNSLDLVSGMTVEGWVNPTASGAAWRTLAMKERPGGLAYALYSDNGDGRASGHVSVPFESRATGTAVPANTWSHLATTYDGDTLRLYLNGNEVSATPVTGAVTVSNGELTMGGNRVWSEWFSGQIDEVRVYDRALSGVELRVDMTRPITCVSDPTAPVLSVEPGSLSFSAQQGGGAPAAKALAVENTGAGTLTWTASSDVPWLSVSPGSGSGAGTVTVTPSIASLSVGTHTGNVTLTAAGATGSPKVVPVTLTVTAPPPGPALGVTPDTLAFTGTQGGSSAAAKTLSVANTGGGTLSWTVSDDASWLTVSPGGGTNAGTITVTPSISGLTAGTYSAAVTVTASGASGSPRVVPVTYVIDPPPLPPVLSISSSTLAFSATAGAQTVETKALNVTNTGGGMLSFTASADVPWMSVSPQSGTAPRAVSVTTSASGLAPGVHTGTVTIAAAGVSGSPKVVTVTFNVTEPPACAAPAGLVGAWGFDEASGTTAVDASPAGNTGTINGATRAAVGRFGGALRFDGTNDLVTVPDSNSLRLSSGLTLSGWVNPATASAAWRTVMIKERSGGLSHALYASTETGRASAHVSTPFESDTRNTSALAAGVWSHLAATYDGATLRLFVNGIQVSSRAVSGAILNDAGPLRFGGNAVWGEYYSGLIDEVRVYNRSLSATELQADMANPVTCSGAPAPAELAVSPTALAFEATQGGSSPAAKTLSVANTGGGTLSWSASVVAPWLEIAPASGTNSGTITVSPRITGLTQGTYTTDLVVTGADATRTIAVTLRVGPPPPVVAVAPSSLAFSGTQGGANPPAKTVEVSNAGGGTLGWTAGENVGWLALAPASGTGTSTITITPSLAGLTAGSYTTEVTVSATGAASRTISVTLTVAPPPPALGVAATSLQFSATEGGGAPPAQNVTVTNTGGGTLSFTVADDAPWLTVTPAGGTAPAALSVTPSISGLSVGTHTATVTVTAAGVAGSPKTIGVTLTVNPAPATPPGLVAAYGFDETSGASVVDSSGNGNLGTISGATRAAAGRFGRALSFDGVNDWATVPDANGLDLTSGVTMSAWINPVTIGNLYRTVLIKEQPGALIYALYAGNGSARPSAHIFTTAEFDTSGTAITPLNTWTHLASTWDGTTLRLFVNGVQVASRALNGTLRTSAGVLRIGGNSIWAAEYFRGLIDEVRIYSRALTLPEIQGDMGRPVPAAG